MRSLLICALVAGLAFGIAPSSADAKRLGGGKSYGMQRNAPDKPAQPPAATPNAPAATPNNAAAAAPTAGAATAAATPKRSWMGPIAGLAAGLGLAALIGHLGLGAEFANFLMLALLAVVAFVVTRFLMRRFAGGNAAGNGGRGLAYAGAGSAPAGGATGYGDSNGANNSAPRSAAPSMFKTADAGALPGSAAAAWAAGGSATTPSTDAAPAASTLPAGFDTAAFERIAKAIFIRLQAANDSGDLKDLRSFTTPELFAELRLDLQERGAATQHTDVVSVDAQVLDYVEEADRQVVSVNFKGLLREEADAEAQPFDEVWHLVKPLDGSRQWAIAGVQQRQ